MGFRIIDAVDLDFVEVTKDEAKKLTLKREPKTVDLTLGDSNGLCMQLSTEEHTRSAPKRNNQSN